MKKSIQDIYGDLLAFLREHECNEEPSQLTVKQVTIADGDRVVVPDCKEPTIVKLAVKMGADEKRIQLVKLPSVTPDRKELQVEHVFYKEFFDSKGEKLTGLDERSFGYPIEKIIKAIKKDGRIEIEPPGNLPKPPGEDLL